VIVHHLPLDMLVDYATGGLEEGPALMVASHVALCAQCRTQVAGFEAVGGALLEDMSPVALSDGVFERVLAGIDAQPQAAPTPAPQHELATILPFALRRYVSSRARWKHAGGGVQEIELKLEEGPHQASLLRIPGGRAMARHRHSGVEFTMVLQGAFTDRGARYAPGDVCLAAEPEHAPLADAGADCICLAVIDGPIVLTGPIGRLLNPWMRLKARRVAARA
jgi:putative transcriptional regulator